MTTFDQVPRFERIALIARAMEIRVYEERYRLWVKHDAYRATEYDPYTNAVQSQEVQEKLQISTSIWDDHIVTADKRGVSVSTIGLRTAIADCAARWQWEREQGK